MNYGGSTGGGDPYGATDSYGVGAGGPGGDSYGGDSYGAEDSFGNSGGDSYGNMGGDSYGNSGGDGYADSGDSYGDSGDSYGEGGAKSYRKCTPYYDTTFERKCLPYKERVCTTQQREKCHDVSGSNCKGIVSSNQVRKCFNVTELLCSLKEDIQYEVIQATYTVQKCQKVTERVCDTVYEAKFTVKDDYRCINLHNIYCYPEEKTIKDTTCKTLTHFDCQQGYSSDSYGSGSGGSAVSTSDPYGQSGGYSPNAAGYGDQGYGGGSSGLGGSGSGGSSIGSDSHCKRRTEKKCYNTPRQVTTEKCEQRSEKSCEKLKERV